MYSDDVIKAQIGSINQKISIEISDLEQKADLARRRDDWALVRFHKESIAKLRRSLKLQPKLDEIKAKMAAGTFKPRDLYRR